MKAHLVLIETSGNQNYIFATNKLRENVGASELTYRVGTQWVLAAVRAVSGLRLWSADMECLRAKLLNPLLNPPLDKSGKKIEVLVATSGKALLLVDTVDTGRAIIQHVTTQALKRAPGIDVCGVISDEFCWDQRRLNDVNREVHEKFEEARILRPGPAMRFQRLPVVDECGTSGLPAARWHVPDKKDGERAAARAAVSLAKRAHRLAYERRMKFMLADYEMDFAKNINQLEKDCDWLAIIHADGNGLGEIFLDFGRYAGCPTAADNRKYADTLREFSLALDVCTDKAFRKAVAQWVAKDKNVWKKFPLLPIVLGGDDLTVVCDGRAALPFTHDFLLAFEEVSATDPATVVLRRVAKEALKDGRLSSCAGVAIVKPHYPFSVAYDLAEGLMQSAKRVKKIVTNPANADKPWPCSTLDFHIHYDASGGELKAIRRQLLADQGKTLLHNRPYVVSLPGRFPVSVPLAGGDWVAQHRYAQLNDGVDALLAKDKDERLQLPNSQMHHLRNSLAVGRMYADQQYGLIRHRYEANGIKQLDGAASSLFAELSAADSKEFPPAAYFTRLQDAMDVASLEAERRKELEKNTTASSAQGGQP